ncbi:tRNA lysidine(34) synthetase TilS [Flavobacterium salilacus subsp. salilacus]|uniref:tRNA lysidine(34) synthetase TilS n=1 Tax=Flavobacterium TaxID=237 RepID=UPI001075395C|nr:MULTISPECIES: tRNA lysidine(34) synthetase TilS [Flavobacterium]KAF2518782.1 tRNA lysidine(34) synthetase TilS [Flavobacterium salilacus subsp. salilacus]MBE1613750.1 tRNA lysidine(34) synthetase TilS [Flavobacterium sp. SaA2.13]
MLTKLQNHLKQNLPFLEGKKLLLAVSGGIDSMVLVHLFKVLNYDVTIAHCNFNLRGEESNGDEIFIKKYTEHNNINFFVTHFDTVGFANDNKLSIQVAARQLRYMWFYELLEENNLDYLLTAHHLDDNLETFLINFIRGTGIDGLTGIPEQNEKIVRPLLPFSREEILAYANEHHIVWREDSSNASDKYLRNKLRHDVIPVLRSLNPSLSDSFQDTLSYLQQAKSLVEDASVLVYKQVVTEKERQKVFDINALKRLPNYKAYLYQWLQPFGFTAWNDIYDLLTAQSGKQVLANGYRLLKDRETLLLEPEKNQDTAVYQIEEGQEAIDYPVSLRFQKVTEYYKESTKNEIFVNYELIKFPLFVRKWQEGDYFCPFGMDGQAKKLSKFFKDEKMSLSEKEDTWFLCSEDKIIWIIGRRADDRFKVTDNTTQILKIEVI